MRHRTRVSSVVLTLALTGCDTARVVITSGQASLSAEEFDVSDGGNRDLVVFDDLLFGEPKA